MTLVVFLVVSLSPGDPLTAWVPADDLHRLNAAEVHALRARLGLDQPLLVRCGRWFGRLVHGDLGRSFGTGQPVLEEIGRRLWPTVELNLAAFGLALAVGVPLGWWAARRAGGRLDRLSGAALLLLYAVPYFWLALLLQNLLAVHWRLFPLYGRTPSSGGGTLVEHLQHLALPSLCLASHQLAFYARFARHTVVSEWRSAHTACARAAGVPEGRIFLRHGVRPSLVPLATQFGLLLPSFAAGSVLIESIFSWPGLGSLFFGAVETRDIPLVLGLTTVAGVLTVAGSLLADVLAFAADPRLRTAGAENTR